MEKIVKKVKRYKTVEDGFDDKITYQSKDGLFFNSEEDAIAQDKKIDFRDYFKEKYCYKNINLDKKYHVITLSNNDHLNFNNRKIRDNLREECKKFFYFSINIDMLKEGLNFIDIDDTDTDYMCYHISTEEELEDIFNETIITNTEYLKKLKFWSEHQTSR